MGRANRTYVFVFAAVVGALFLATVLFGGGEEVPAPDASATDASATDASATVEPGDAVGALANLRADRGDEPGDSSAGPGRPKVREFGQIYAFDASDDRRLVGYSEAVFVGKAERKVGEDPLTSTIPGDEGQPREQWAVRVAERGVIKGEDEVVEPGSEATVNVFGGEDPETGLPIAVVSEGKTPHAVDTPIQEGETYIFAVRTNPRTGWLDVSAQPQGKILVTGQTQLDERVEELLAALEEQIDPLKEQGIPNPASNPDRIR